MKNFNISVGHFNKIFFLNKNYILKYNRNFFSMKLSSNDYLNEIHRTLGHINDCLDNLDIDEVDCNYDGSGVLSFEITNNKKFVLNIQRPNQQLWLSSPVSGPYKFEFDLEKKCWIDLKHNYELYGLLTKEINILFNEFKINTSINLLI